MARRALPRRGPRRPRKISRTRLHIARLWPNERLRREILQAFRRAPLALRIAIVLALAFMLWLALNGVYQIVRKPSELFFPVSGTLNKTPAETWRQYAPLFLKYSTNVMTPELLAALAQVEASGNPVARTYWRWAWKPEPFEVYRPASSAVGMYQITDGTFAEARRYCIKDHKVVEDGPWNDWQSCWLTRFYTRVIPSHAVELTAAYLDRGVATALVHHHGSLATLQQKQELAAVIHLCGAGAGDNYARHGLRLLEGQRCGDQEVRAYIARVDAQKRVFTMLAAGHERM
jgi:hypothetical protein